jgi:hypothetical protein
MYDYSSVNIHVLLFKKCTYSAISLPEEYHCCTNEKSVYCIETNQVPRPGQPLGLLKK